jgi:hypothetical protein
MTAQTPGSNNTMISHGKPQDERRECGCHHYLTIRQHDLKKEQRPTILHRS